MKKCLTILLVALLLLLAFASTASASTKKMPTGGCVDGFQLMGVMDNCSASMSMHIGIDQDLNGDGYLCVQVVSPDLHVHVDNTYPLP